jgi:hypothetical protein
MTIIREIPAPLHHRKPVLRVVRGPVIVPRYRDDEIDDESFAPWFLAVALGRREYCVNYDDGPEAA